MGIMAEKKENVIHLCIRKLDTMGNNSQVHRVYGQSVNINLSEVKQFWQKRVDKDNILGAVMLRDNGDIPQRRDIHEKGLLERILWCKAGDCVLDIGCGIGRLTDFFVHKVKLYQGIDFVKAYIEANKQQYAGFPQVAFQEMSATDIREKELVCQEYDIVVTTGLMMYLNDTDCKNLMRKLVQLVKPGGRVYIRESVSVIGMRLTLKDFFSDELSVNYNAVYRTIGEYVDFFGEYLFPQGFRLIKTDLLLTPELGAREETNQAYFLLVRE